MNIAGDLIRICFSAASTVSPLALWGAVGMFALAVVAVFPVRGRAVYCIVGNAGLLYFTAVVQSGQSPFAALRAHFLLASPERLTAWSWGLLVLLVLLPLAANMLFEDELAERRVIRQAAATRAKLKTRAKPVPNWTVANAQATTTAARGRATVNTAKHAKPDAEADADDLVRHIGGLSGADDEPPGEATQAFLPGARPIEQRVAARRAA